MLDSVVHYRANRIVGWIILSFLAGGLTLIISTSLIMGNEEYLNIYEGYLVPTWGIGLFSFVFGSVTGLLSAITRTTFFEKGWKYSLIWKSVLLIALIVIGLSVLAASTYVGFIISLMFTPGGASSLN